MRRVARHPAPPSPIRALAALGVTASLAAACGFDKDTVDPGLSSTRVAIVDLLGEPIPPAPIAAPTTTSRGSAIATHAGEIFVVDRDNGDLVVMSQADLAVLRRVALGDRPEHVVVSRAGAAYVTVRGDGEVVRVDPGASTVAARRAVGAEPWGIALAPDEGTVYVSLTGKGALVGLDAALTAVTSQQQLGGTLRGVAIDAHGRVAVADQHGPLRIIEPRASGATLHLGALRTSQPFEVAGHELPGTPTRALAVVADPGAERFHVAHVIARPGDVASAPSDELPDVPDEGGGAPAAYAETSADVPPLRTSVTSLDPTGGVLGDPLSHTAAGERGALIDAVDQPSDIVHHTTWSLLLVTGAGTDNVVVMSSNDDQPLRGVLGVFDVGAAPRGVAISDDGAHAFVLEGGSFRVSELDLSPFISTFAPPTNRGFVSTRSAAYGVDPLPANLQAGRRLFEHVDDRIGKSAGFACASCHFDGGEDKLTWPVEGMLRQTPMLAGRLADTAPYNWLGSEDTLVHNIRRTIGRMGGDDAAFSDDELQALADYITVGFETPASPWVGPTLTAEQALGKSLFEDQDVGCARCHAGPALTDGRSHFIGTGSVPLDTPSLRGLHATAPYFHDGAAATLRDVLERPDSSMLGGADLSDAEKDALVAYLLTL